MENNKRVNLLYGLLCLLLGGLWLLNTMGRLPWQMTEYLFSWRFLLVLIGSLIIIKNSRSVFGLLVFATGIVSTLALFWNLPDGWEDFLPPVALMLVGLILVLRPNHANRLKLDIDEVNGLNRATLFGSYKSTVTSVLFKGGYLSAVFGNNIIDFTRTHLGKDVVKVQCINVFGSSVLIVPANWDVKIETFNVFGSSEDKRIVTDSVSEKEGTFIVSGFTLFGNLKIRN